MAIVDRVEGQRTYTYDIAQPAGIVYDCRVSDDIGRQNAYAVAGRDVAATESRGRVLLVIDETQVDPARGINILPELERYKLDLIGDGRSGGRCSSSGATPKPSWPSGGRMKGPPPRRPAPPDRSVPPPACTTFGASLIGTGGMPRFKR